MTYAHKGAAAEFGKNRTLRLSNAAWRPNDHVALHFVAGTFVMPIFSAGHAMKLGFGAQWNGKPG